jgi:hypothetical protein
MYTLYLSKKNQANFYQATRLRGSEHTSIQNQKGLFKPTATFTHSILKGQDTARDTTVIALWRFHEHGLMSKPVHLMQLFLLLVLIIFPRQTVRSLPTQSLKFLRSTEEISSKPMCSMHPQGDEFLENTKRCVPCHRRVISSLRTQSGKFYATARW